MLAENNGLNSTIQVRYKFFLFKSNLSLLDIERAFKEESLIQWRKAKVFQPKHPNATRS